MVLQRTSMIFQVTTVPKDAAAAIPHTGGWTEGHWDDVGYALDSAALTTVMQARAGMLPKQAAILGIRAQQYTIAGNKLIPGGAASVKRRFPGLATYNVNIPQDAMGFTAAMAGSPNAIRFKTKCLPDEVIEQGEFNGNPVFKGKMTAYGNRMVLLGLGAVVKDLTQPSFSVISLVAGVLTLSGAGAAAVGEYLILRRVKDHLTDKPISGSFRVKAVSSAEYTLDGVSLTAVAIGGGFARKDLIKFAAYNSIEYGRVGDGKIGGPFEKYRGRRSKRRR